MIRIFLFPHIISTCRPIIIIARTQECNYCSCSLRVFKEQGFVSLDHFSIQLNIRKPNPSRIAVT